MTEGFDGEEVDLAEVAGCRRWRSGGSVLGGFARVAVTADAVVWEESYGGDGGLGDAVCGGFGDGEDAGSCGCPCQGRGGGCGGGCGGHFRFGWDLMVDGVIICYASYRMS